MSVEAFVVIAVIVVAAFRGSTSRPGFVWNDLVAASGCAFVLSRSESAFSGTGGVGEVIGYVALWFFMMIWYGAIASFVEQAIKALRRRLRLDIPSTFDLSNPDHVEVLDNIRTAYGDHLSDDQSPYHRCMFEPASQLPYQKRQIATALGALLDFVEGRRESPLLDASLRDPEFADLIRSILSRLALRFIDMEPSELPTDPRENGRVGAAVFRGKQQSVKSRVVCKSA